MVIKPSKYSLCPIQGRDVNACRPFQVNIPLKGIKPGYPHSMQVSEPLTSWIKAATTFFLRNLILLLLCFTDKCMKQHLFHKKTERNCSLLFALARKTKQKKNAA